MPAPTPPPPPRRLRFAPTRPQASMALDGAQVKPRGAPALAIPPFTPWAAFRPWFSETWEQGQHIALAARSQSGKTTLARNILGIRDHVVVFATKVKDPALYTPLQREGYEMVSHFDASDLTKPYVIFKPPLTDPTRNGKAKQAEEFRNALIDIFMTGGWTVYCDEIRYLSEDLGLAQELNTLYLQGSSLGVTMVAATQRPVSVPLNVFMQASKFFLWRVNDADDRKRASQFLGPNSMMARELLGSLPQYEALYVDVVTDQSTRTRVDTARTA